jgi:hypothetical protein
LREHGHEGACQADRVLRIDEQALDAVVDEIEHTACAGRYDPAPAGEGLDDDAAKPFVARRQDEQRRVVERCGHALRRQLRDQLDAARQLDRQLLDLGLQRSLADDNEARIRQAVRDAPPGGDEAVDVLVTLERAPWAFPAAVAAASR